MLFKHLNRRNQISSFRRHIQKFVRHGTPAKYWNLFRAYSAYLRGATRISSMPAFLKVEVSRYCEVHCKYCWHDKAPVFYPFPLYKQIIDRLGKYAFFVSLYDIGEPLQCTTILDYVRYAHVNNVGTVISTTLSVAKTEEFWEQLVLSGLDHLIVAIDGVSGAVYRQYRTNANIELVMENLKSVIRFKMLHKASMFIEWQMIDLPWNKGEQAEARALAHSLGCSGFNLIPEVMRIEFDYERENVRRKRNCLLPYILFFVTAHNRMRLCYRVYNRDLTVGSLDDSTFDDLWNCDAVAMVRDKKRITLRPGCCTCQACC